MTLLIQGWARSTQPGVDIARVTFTIDGALVGETSLLHPRVDVAAAHQLNPGSKLGFARVLSVPDHAKKTSIQFAVNVVLEDGKSYELTSRQVNLTGKDYRSAGFGFMLDPASTAVKKRDEIYGSGPSLAEGSADLVGLLKRELGHEIKSILDVGCGLGFYGRILRSAGYDWMGVEVKEEDGRKLQEAALPYQLTNGQTLPFPDQSYDAVICIEVLEHIENLDTFLSEIARVVRKRVLISVPNVELIPYLSAHAVVPWHMLEGDHKNFFTRANLEALLRKYFHRAEVQLYAPCPLQSAEGVKLYYNLFAIAETAHS